MPDDKRLKDELAAEQAVLEDALGSAEAGVADVIAVYEQAEARYVAAAARITPYAPDVAYTTHT